MLLSHKSVLIVYYGHIPWWLGLVAYIPLWLSPLHGSCTSPARGNRHCLPCHCNRWRSGWCSWSWALSCLDTCFGISTAWLVVWKPLCLDPSDGVFGRFDLAALCGCHTLNVCCCCMSTFGLSTDRPKVALKATIHILDRWLPL